MKYPTECALTWAQSNRADAYDDPCDDCTMKDLVHWRDLFTFHEMGPAVEPSDGSKAWYSNGKASFLAEGERVTASKNPLGRVPWVTTIIKEITCT